LIPLFFIFELLKRIGFIGLAVPLLLLVWYFIPSGNTNYNLFYIDRNKDNNIIKYDIKLKENGELNMEEPINMYWVKNTDGGKKEGLNYAQKKLAYGLKYVKKEDDEIKFQFVSYGKRTFILRKLKGKSEYNVITYLNNKTVIVNRIYIHITGGTYFVPKIAYLQLYWKDAYSDKEGIEKVIP